MKMHENHKKLLETIREHENEGPGGPQEENDIRKNGAMVHYFHIDKGFYRVCAVVLNGEWTYELKSFDKSASYSSIKRDPSWETLKEAIKETGGLIETTKPKKEYKVCTCNNCRGALGSLANCLRKA